MIQCRVFSDHYSNARGKWGGQRGAKTSTHTLHLTGRNTHTVSTLTLCLGMGKHHLLKAKCFSILWNKHLKHSIHHVIESGTGYLYYKVSNCEESIKANAEK